MGFLDLEISLIGNRGATGGIEKFETRGKMVKVFVNDKQDQNFSKCAKRPIVR